MKDLKLVHPDPIGRDLPRIEFESTPGRDSLEVRFAVHCNAIHTIQAPKDRSHWGLWEGDVVELFVAPGPDPLPYYEFQVSPLGQFFELEIFEPRKRFNREFRSGFKYAVTPFDGKGWSAKLEIPLAAIGARSDRAAPTRGQPGPRASGGAFAILGPAHARTYWASNLPRQETPDFHLPEFFKTEFFRVF